MCPCICMHMHVCPCEILVRMYPYLCKCISVNAHACMHERVRVCSYVLHGCVCVCEQLTFVSDEVSAEDDEEAEQDEDDNSHHPSDHRVVHPRRGRHGCGVLRGGWWDGEEKGERRMEKVM